MNLIGLIERAVNAARKGARGEAPQPVAQAVKKVTLRTEQVQQSSTDSNNDEAKAEDGQYLILCVLAKAPN